MVYPCNHLETSCTAVIEAQAAGVPVISSKLGALTESVIDNITGVLIPGDPTSDEYQQKFIDTVIEFLTNAQKWKNFSLNAIKKVQSLYDWKLIAIEWEKEINALMEIKSSVRTKK